MNDFRFRASARLQRYLGKELIADPNLAIVEFVKNAYDAHATNVYVTFSLADAPTPTLTIADDGDGMDETSFERNWMHPGYSEKASDAPHGSQGASPRRGRVPVGEKGLGRLAAGRLGNALDIFTRKRPRDPWLHVRFDWHDFDDMTKHMDDIPIAYDFDTIPLEAPVKSGTIAVISGLEQTWDGRMRGRPSPGRSRTRLGRLKQDLQLLVRPLQATEDQFTVHLDSDLFLDPGDIGIINPAEASTEADYVYEFEFDVTPKNVAVIRRKLTRSVSIITELGGKPSVTFPIVNVAEVARTERRPTTLDCGSFRGVFLYTPPPAAKRAREIDAKGAGVLLYRDRVLVEPYGLDGDDWVGVSARKAQRQGYAPVQPNVFSGYVLIDRSKNPGLTDMSNRQGLLLNDASEAFLEHVRAEFAYFEAQISPELQQRWEPKEEKAARQAEDAIDLAAVRLRAVGHSLGQPLLGLDADIKAIRYVAEREDVPDAARRELVELADSAAAHLGQARAAIARFRDVPVPERSDVEVHALVKQAVEQVQLLAGSLGAELVVEASLPRRSVFVHGELVAEAVAELIRNALEASGEAGRPRTVRVGAREEHGDIVLEISDNGSGIPNASPGSSLMDVVSTKGRPGMGLRTVVEIITASRGRVNVVSSGPDGTHLEVLLPDRMIGLRR